MMKLPRVANGIHVLLFIVAFAVVFIRLWVPPGLGIFLAALAAAVFVFNLLWLLLSRDFSAGRVLLFLAGTLAAIAVFFVGLLVGLQLNPTLGTVLVVAAAAIFGFSIVRIVRAGRS